MKSIHSTLLFLVLIIPSLYADTTTTPAPNDPEAQVKCDACVLVAKKVSNRLILIINY